MLKVKLKKIESNHSKLRSDVIEGKCTHVPEEGQTFEMFAESLTPDGAFRHITTSPIRECRYDEKDREFIFKTENSLYGLEVIDEKDPFDYSRIRGQWTSKQNLSKGEMNDEFDSSYR